MSNAPVKKFRLGLVTATIWKSEPDNGKPFYTVQLQRQYRDQAGDWKATDYLNHDDLLGAAKVLERSEEWIASQ